MRLFGSSESGMRAISRRAAIVSILDVGSTKICCLIARLIPLEPDEASDTLRGRTHSIEVLGIGHQRSRGIKSGVVTNLDAAEQAIRLAVDAAERMAGITVESLIVNVSCGRLQGETYSATVALSGQEVGESEIGRVLAAGRRHSITEGRSLVHSLPIGYSIDADGGIADPRGMAGQQLGVDMHMVTADSQPLRNLELCINRSHLSIETLVASPYASGLSVLVEDEAELGCACIDFGGGTTTLAVFMKGQFVHVDAIAVGGQHITTDIARGLSTSLEGAERLKTMHGNTLPTTSDDNDILSVPPIGDEGDVPNQIPRSALTRIIRPRIEEILELVRDRLNSSGFASMVGRRMVLTGGASQLTGLAEAARRILARNVRLGRRMVLTGGASQLTGLAEAARRILARNVRLGRPLGVAGMPEVAKGPAFATSVGLLIYPQVAEFEQYGAGSGQVLKMTGTGGYISRVGQWIRENF